MSIARVSLDGSWDFLHVSDDRASGPAEIRQIRVPGVWQAQFEDLRTRAGIGLYNRLADIPDDWIGTPVFLMFGAAFHSTRAWINGQMVGRHEGGFLPFKFEVGRYLVPGTNEITVRVDSPTDDPDLFSDIPLAEIPFGKQSWYGPLSGIWQSVGLERRARDHVLRLRLIPDSRSGRVRTHVVFAAPLEAASTLVLSVLSPHGLCVAEARLDLPAGIGEFDIDVDVASPMAWSPDTPLLYTACAELRRGDVAVDRHDERFGFRTFEARGGRFWLNDRPFYLRGALDQDYYPDLVATAPSAEFLRDQFRKAKAMGLNCIRLHIKLPDPLYYEIADEIGLLVWAELPNGGIATDRSRRRKEALLKGMVDRDGNHPCIVIWTIINENWGVDLVHDPDHRDWLKRTRHWLKAYDPLRLVVDNSPLQPSFHVETDIADYHFYAGIPDHREDWDAFVGDLASRPSWLYSPHGDAVATGEEPLMVSEFGNWGLPFPSDLVDANGREPWWFETGHDWGEGVMYAHGIENRFLDWSLDRVFGPLRAFVQATQWQQFRALKYEIEAMRHAPTLAGYVVTEFTDAHWESNGLLDMRRNPRVFADAFRTINADIVVLPYRRKAAYWAGETATIDLAMANGSAEAITGATLAIEGVGLPVSLPVPDCPPSGVCDIAEWRVTLPEASEPRMLRLRFRLLAANGREIATNMLDLAVHPRRVEAAAASREQVWSPDDDVQNHVEGLGWRVVPRLEDATMIVAREHDDRIAAAVRAGARLVLLPERDGTLYPFFPHWQNVKVVERAGTPWRGDWASSFAWVARRGPFRTLPGGPLIDDSFDRVIPMRVIKGCNLIDFQARVAAGLVVGWIHKPVALAVERTYGRGRFVASTFRLFRDPPGDDPTATALFDGLVAMALREQPTAAPRLAGDAAAM